MRVTITDLARETDLQHRLNLGITASIREQTLARRSNIDSVLYDDMTRSSLADESFDCVVAVEVLEHVEEDLQFIRQVHRVLKPNGYFLMTTPNGDFVRNTNPDHKRHYTRIGLQSLLESCFANVLIEYAIPCGVWHRLGLRSWSLRHPGRTALSMVGNLVNAIQSMQSTVKARAIGTRHLLAIAQKGTQSGEPPGLMKECRTAPAAQSIGAQCNQ